MVLSHAGLCLLSDFHVLGVAGGCGRPFLPPLLCAACFIWGWHLQSPSWSCLELGPSPLHPAVLGSVQLPQWLEQLVNEPAQMQLPGQPKAKRVRLGDAA